ncbi:MAG: DUF1465 family protein, partial [Oricola sp.]|nr:DUF1465 family protein [Oricola sp.]
RLLVKRSLRLQAYVQRLDQDLFGELVAAPMPALSNDNPVGSQIELLRTAFAAR